MKFSEFISSKSIKVNMVSEGKTEAVAELVQGLVDAGSLDAAQKDGIIQAVMNREELGSTGIGRGVAVPHTKHSSVKEIVGTVGVSKSGIDFRSLDGDKVNLFFMLISPPDRPSDHLRALENIAKQLQNESFCSFLKQSKSVEDVVQLLNEADENHFGS
jgi:mannitol/fructose-specific phosphotransferase system IIA component (Ntr-type)